MSLIAISEPGPLARAEPARSFVWAGCQVELTGSLKSLEADWRRLEAAGGASMFQSFDYLVDWITGAAAPSGEEPLFAVGSKGADAAFILPVALTRRYGVQVLTWLGHAHSNYGMAVAEEGVLEGADADIDQLIIGVARLAGAGLVHLDKQPAEWAGRANPFARSRHCQTSANDTFILTLDDDYAAQHGRLFSGRTVSGLKRKLRKMEELGPVAFNSPDDPARKQEIIDWFIAEKRVQLAQTGRESPFDPDHIRALYHTLAADSATFQVDEVTVGDQRIAMGMTAYQATTAYLINTVYVGGEFGRYSPGTQLMHRMVAAAHAKGARTYDFGPGELPYKLEWEPKAVPLLASTYLIKPTALVAYGLLVLGVAAKCAIKRNPRLNGWVQWLRARRA